MSAINQMIARGVDPIQVQSPVNQLAQFEQIRSAQQTNALRQAEMQQLQQQQMRENQLREALRRPGVVSPTGRISREAAFAGVDPGIAPELEEKIGKAEKSRLERLTAQDQATVGRMKLFTERYAQARSVPEFKAIAMESFQDPVLGDFLAKTGVTPDAVLQKIDEIAMQNPQQELIELKRGAIMNADRLAQSFVERGTPSPLGKLQDERQTLLDQGVPFNDARIRQYDQRIAKETAMPGPSTVVMGAQQESALQKRLGERRADRLIEQQGKAADAAKVINNIDIGRDLLNQGTIVGYGAEGLATLNAALERAGLDFGYNDAAANTRAYIATMGGNVGSIITLFGAGTGLSDADREYAKIMAGGDVNLTEDALRKILLINEVQSRYAIDQYNKSVEKVAPELMAEVPPPSSEYTSYMKDFKAGKVKGVTNGSAPLRPDATPVGPGGRAAAPTAAVEFLRQNDTPDNRRFFDQKYGAGASRSALGR
jgi:hypothetical protein